MASPRSAGPRLAARREPPHGARPQRGPPAASAGPGGHAERESPLLGPAAATAGGGDNLVEGGSLYAGEVVAQIDDIRPAGELVRELVP